MVFRTVRNAFKYSQSFQDVSCRRIFGFGSLNFPSVGECVSFSLSRTFVTHSFIELHIWHTIIDVIVVFLYSKMIEPLWGTRELLKFYFIVTIPNALVATFTYFIFYGLTFNEDYLFERPIYGLAPFIGAYAVVIKQLMPDTILATTPLFKLKQDHVPLLLVILSTILWLVHAVPIHFLITLSFGIIISWTYLRFFQMHQNGTKGNMASSFSLAR